MFIYITSKLREYIFIILTATIFFLLTFSKSLSQENVFIINNVKVEGATDINFTRDKYIDKAFLDSFKMLMTKILLSDDLDKLKNIKLKEVKTLINHFQVLDESYQKDKYVVSLKIFYNDKKVQKLLFKKNISYSQPKNITVVFFPVLFINDEIKNFSENYFYKEWNNVDIKNETLNFITPIEYLDDISEIKKMKNKIEELDINNFVNKYDTKNYAFALMSYNNQILNMHIKTNFDGIKVNRNFSYEIDNIKNEKKLFSILSDLKIKISDIWKESNIINLLMPLSIKIKFNHTKLLHLDELKNAFSKISIINNYKLEEFNINHTFFKINYYGNPKKLRAELLKFGYLLDDDKGYWEIKTDD